MIKLKEVAFVFLRLGFIAFGGPAAHIAMMEDEIVMRRKWLTHQHFLDLVGATNLIPGPNSTEMVIHCGYIRAGVPGLIVAGLSFILPAVLISGLLAYLYEIYGSIPELEPFFYGIKPAVIIIILNAVFRLGVKSIKASPKREWKLLSIAFAVAFINFLGINEIYSIIFGGIFGALLIFLSEKKNILALISPLLLPASFIFQVIEKQETSLTKLFLVCLKIGAVWFGSGYILVAYFDGEFVQGLNWLTRRELLDAIAVGQFTPGPLLSSVTFIGYLIAGFNGAVLATIGIVLPSFIFVLIINPLVPRLRNSRVLSVLLDAVNAGAVAVMFVIGIKLCLEVLINWQTNLIALLSLIAFFRIKNINSAYIVAGGALTGWLLSLI